MNLDLNRAVELQQFNFFLNFNTFIYYFQFCGSVKYCLF